jgi:hypothetical protein
VLRWLFSWEEAAQRPRQTVIASVLLAFVPGALYGYLAFGHSVGYGLAFGLGVALVCGTFTWKTVRDPARVAELTDQRAQPARALRHGAIRLALPFAALGIAVAVGTAVGSVSVFVITLVAGLAAALVVRRFLPR